MVISRIYNVLQLQFNAKSSDQIKIDDNNRLIIGHNEVNDKLQYIENEILAKLSDIQNKKRKNSEEADTISKVNNLLADKIARSDIEAVNLMTQLGLILINK